MRSSIFYGMAIMDGYICWSGVQWIMHPDQKILGLIPSWLLDFSNVTCRAHEPVSILGPVKCTGRASSVKQKRNQYPYHLWDSQTRAQRRENESLSLNVVTGKAGERPHVTQKWEFCVFRSPRVKEQGWKFRRRVQAVFIRVVIGRGMERHSSR